MACDQVADKLVINGLPEMDNGNTKAVVGDLVKSLRIQSANTEITNAHRVGRKARATESASSNMSTGTSLSIFLTARTVDFCNKIISAKKEKPDLTAKQVNMSFPEIKIYINRCQPTQLHQLRDRVIKAFPHIMRKHIGIANGAVYIKKLQNDRPIRIFPSTDLQKLSI